MSQLGDKAVFFSIGLRALEGQGPMIFDSADLKTKYTISLNFSQSSKKQVEGQTGRPGVHSY